MTKVQIAVVGSVTVLGWDAYLLSERHEKWPGIADFWRFQEEEQRTWGLGLPFLGWGIRFVLSPIRKGNIQPAGHSLESAE